MKKRGHRSHTVTRSEYYRGRRMVDPDRTPEKTVPNKWDNRDALIDADYPRVDPEEAFQRSWAMQHPDP